MITTAMLHHHHRRPRQQAPVCLDRLRLGPVLTGILLSVIRCLDAGIAAVGAFGMRFVRLGLAE